jgi:hypothetical protein
MGQALSYTEIANRIKATRDGKYLLVTKNDPQNPILSRTPIQVVHTPCGTILDTKFQHFVNDNKGHCRKCYPVEQNQIKAPISVEEFKTRLVEIFGDEVVYVSGWISTKQKCMLRHSCGNEYLSLPKDRMVSKTHGCSECVNTKSRGKYAIVENYLESILEEGYKWLDEYKNDNKAFHKIEHIKCGHIYEVRPNDFQQGYRCPECSSTTAPQESRNAKRIKAYLDELGADYIMEYIDARCKSDLNGQLRFDFAIKCEDKFIIIEYDGEFHSGETFTTNE